MQAVVMYELALHFNPHCPEACNNLGVIYKDRDNLDRAVECYQVGFTRIFLECRYLSWPLTQVARIGIFRENSETETRVHFAVVWDGSMTLWQDYHWMHHKWWSVCSCYVSSSCAGDLWNWRDYCHVETDGAGNKAQFLSVSEQSGGGLHHSGLLVPYLTQCKIVFVVMLSCPTGIKH